jgi:SAM-dependent methyltransferase
VTPVLTEAKLQERIAATQSDHFYDRDYFEKPKDVSTESGYAGYGPNEPGIDAAARIIAHYFRPKRVLEVGCAKGFVVDLLRRRGFDAWGVDFSRYAIRAAPARVRGFVAVGDILDLKFPDNSFDLVACIETLEHLTPERAAQAVAELCRVTSDKLWVTIPSLGVNDFGPPDGWPQGKIREEALSRYTSGQGFPDPAPIEDLMLDRHGYPIHGHLIAASYRWWTEIFTRQGLVRRGDIERQINGSEPLVSTGQWNSYVLEKAHVDPSFQRVKQAERAAVAQVTELALDSNGGKDVASPWKPEMRVQVPDAGGPEGLLLHASGTHLPPGWYEVEFCLGIQEAAAQSNPWAEVAVLDVRSREQGCIHALRTVRLQDFASTSQRTFALSFASGGEPDLEFRAQLSGHGLGYSASKVSIIARVGESPKR